MRCRSVFNRLAAGVLAAVLAIPAISLPAYAEGSPGPVVEVVDVKYQDQYGGYVPTDVPGMGIQLRNSEIELPVTNFGGDFVAPSSVTPLDANGPVGGGSTDGGSPGGAYPGSPVEPVSYKLVWQRVPSGGGEPVAAVNRMLQLDDESVTVTVYDMNDVPVAGIPVILTSPGFTINPKITDHEGKATFLNNRSSEFPGPVSVATPVFYIQVGTRYIEPLYLQDQLEANDLQVLEVRYFDANNKPLKAAASSTGSVTNYKFGLYDVHLFPKGKRQEKLNKMFNIWENGIVTSYLNRYSLLDALPPSSDTVHAINLFVEKPNVAARKKYLYEGKPIHISQESWHADRTSESVYRVKDSLFRQEEPSASALGQFYAPMGAILDYVALGTVDGVGQIVIHDRYTVPSDGLSGVTVQLSRNSYSQININSLTDSRLFNWLRIAYEDQQMGYTEHTISPAEDQPILVPKKQIYKLNYGEITSHNDTAPLETILVWNHTPEDNRSFTVGSPLKMEEISQAGSQLTFGLRNLEGHWIDTLGELSAEISGSAANPPVVTVTPGVISDRPAGIPLWSVAVLGVLDQLETRTVNIYKFVNDVKQDIAQANIQLDTSAKQNPAMIVELADEQRRPYTEPYLIRGKSAWVWVTIKNDKDQPLMDVTVRMNGELVGKTDFTGKLQFQLSPGNANLTFEKSGFRIHNQRLVLYDPSTQGVVRIGAVPIEGALSGMNFLVREAAGTNTSFIETAKSGQWLAVPAGVPLEIDAIQSGLQSDSDVSSYGHYLHTTASVQAGEQADWIINALSPQFEAIEVTTDTPVQELYLISKGLDGIMSPARVARSYMLNPATVKFFASPGEYRAYAVMNNRSILMAESVVIDNNHNVLNFGSNQAVLRSSNNLHFQNVSYQQKDSSPFFANVDTYELHMTPGTAHVNAVWDTGTSYVRYQIPLTKERLQAGVVEVHTGAPHQLQFQETPGYPLVVWLLDQAGNKIMGETRYRQVVYNQVIEQYALDTPIQRSVAIYKNGTLLTDPFQDTDLPFVTIPLQTEDGRYRVEVTWTQNGRTITGNNEFIIGDTPTSSAGGGGGGFPPMIPPAAQPNEELKKLLDDSKDKPLAEMASQAAELIRTFAGSSVSNNEERTKALDSANELLALLQQKAKGTANRPESTPATLRDSLRGLLDQAAVWIAGLDQADAAVQHASKLLQSSTGLLPATTEDSKLLTELAETALRPSLTLSADTVLKDAASLEKSIEAARKAQNLLANDLRKAANAAITPWSERTLTIVGPSLAEGSTAPAAELTLDANVREAMAASGVAGWRMEFGSIGLQAPADAFGSWSDSDKPITFAAKHAADSDGAKPDGARELPQMPVVEFEAAAGGESIGNLPAPFRLVFSVPQAAQKSGKSGELVVYRLNETTRTWEPVGGVYDADSSTISVPRSHFSVYTVMVAAAESFPDVDPQHWALDEIGRLLARGIIDREPEFAADTTITRKQFAAWAVRSFGLLLDGEVEHPFSDVSAATPYAQEIASAYASGLIEGRSDDAFAPNEAITRQEMAALLSRAIKQYDARRAADAKQSTAAFADSQDIGDWATDAVAHLRSLGIVDGYEDGRFQPGRSITKAEAAAMLYRLYP